MTRVQALKAVKSRQERMKRPEYVVRDQARQRQDVHRDYRDGLRELRNRVSLLEVSSAEHYCLLRALEERVGMRDAD